MSETLTQRVSNLEERVEDLQCRLVNRACLACEGSGIIRKRMKHVHAPGEYGVTHCANCKGTGREQ